MKRNHFVKFLLLTSFLSFSFLFNSTKVNALSYVFTIKVLQTPMIEYPATKFKAGTTSVVKPKINNLGGKFSCKRVSVGNGQLVINSNSGIIDLGNSDPGVYEITYKTNLTSITISITLL